MKKTLLLIMFVMVSGHLSAAPESSPPNTSTEEHGTILWLKKGCIAILNSSAGENTMQQTVLSVSVSNFLGGYSMGSDAMAFHILGDGNNKLRPRADDVTPLKLAPIILEYINSLPIERQNENTIKYGAFAILNRVYFEKILGVDFIPKSTIK